MPSNMNYTCKVVHAQKRTHKSICMLSKSVIGLYMIAIVQNPFKNDHVHIIYLQAL
jgi:hypothetical protein